MSAVSGPPQLDLLKALGDNTRYAIYLELARSARPLATADISASLALHPNTVRPHLERMREAGLLRQGGGLGLRRCGGFLRDRATVIRIGLGEVVEATLLHQHPSAAEPQADADRNQHGARTDRGQSLPHGAESIGTTSPRVERRPLLSARNQGRTRVPGEMGTCCFYNTFGNLDPELPAAPQDVGKSDGPYLRPG